MTTPTKSFTRWAALCLLILPFLSVANSEPVRWNIDTHQPHFADINGDGVDDLLLQANTPDGQHSLVFGFKVNGSHGQYLASNQQTMPAKLAGSDWAVSQGRVTLADFNGDGFADLLVVLPDDQIALTFLSDNRPVELTAQVAQQYDAGQLGWLSDAGDYAFWPGDFNGDGRQDLLAVSAQKRPHHVMLSDADGWLSVTQTIKKNVKWGKQHAEQLLVADYNNDGRDDVFALSKKRHKAHHLVLADDQGQLVHSDTLSAQLDAQHWDADSFSVVTDVVNDAPGLVRMHNALGGIDEYGEVISPPTLQANTSDNLTYSVANGVSGITSVTTVPATPALPPNTNGSSFKALGSS